MTSIITCQNSLYKAAIALNNTAVTLLERQQFRDAVNTFRHAIGAIQLVIEETKNPSTLREGAFLAHFNEFTSHLEEASQRCAQSYIANENATKCSTASNGNNVVVVKFSSQQPAMNVLETIIQASHDGTTQVYACLVIELVDQDESYFESVGEVCNSIMYNFGLAHSILACQFNPSMKTEQIVIQELQERAFQLLRLIEPFFVARFGCSPNEFQDRGVLLLCVLFARTMSTVTHHLQYPVLGESYKDTLRAILRSIDAQETLIPTMNRHAAMA